MNDQSLVKAFEAYMTQVERFAPETIETHMRTVTEWCNFLAGNGAPELRDITDRHALDFIEANNIVINENGNLIMYKIVARTNNPEVFLDLYTRKIEHRFGQQLPRLSRNEVDDDINVTCSKGLKVVASY